MLDPKYVLENAELIIKKMKARGLKISLDSFKKLSTEKKKYLLQAENLRSERNKASQLVAQLKRQGKDASSLISDMKKVSEEIKRLEEKLKEIEEKLNKTLLTIPNVPHKSVPEGQNSDDNIEVRRFGEQPKFSFPVKAHWEIGKKLGILNFERAAKIAGSRFAVYLGKGAQLERALINFMLDIHTRKNGYQEVIPPFIANEKSLTGTGNLPKFENDLFKLRGYQWYMIPTAEVPLTNLYQEEILEAAASDGKLAPTARISGV